MKTLSVMVLASFLLVSHAFAANGTARFKSTSGTAFSVSYYTLGVAGGDTMVYASVDAGIQLSAADAANAGEVTMVYVTNCGGSLISTSFVMSPYGGGGFSSRNTLKLPYMNHSGYCAQEVAVKVGDAWLTDPMNGTHNFKYEMK